MNIVDDYEDVRADAHKARGNENSDAWFAAGVKAAEIWLRREHKHGRADMLAETVAKAVTKAARFHVSTDAVVRAALDRGHRIFAGDMGRPVIVLELGVRR